MLSYCVARVILVAKIENWWLTLIQHLLIISAYYLWFALDMVNVTDCISDLNHFRYRYQVLPKKSFDLEFTSTMIA